MSVATRLWSFSHHPAQSLGWRLKRLAFEVPARAQLQRHGILADLDRFAAARPGGAFAADQFGDYWFLYKMVRRRRPAIVWEFGSGNSTVVLARALRDNGTGFLYSLDADEAWANGTAAAMPAEFCPYCRVVYSPVAEVTCHGVPGFRHTVLPEPMPNLVYLDGPALTTERQVAVDVLDIEARLPSDFVLIIDDRKANTRFLHEHLTRRYAFAPRRHRVQPVFRLM